MITNVYFVRHAQPNHLWEEDRTRPLTGEGKQDSNRILNFFKGVPIDEFFCSPYQRSIDTIAATAQFFDKEIIIDERFRERESGFEGNNHGMFQKRWSDKDFHEEGGESIHMVQKRNIEALNDVLKNSVGKTVVIGTHGTALSSILNYYEPEFDCNSFLRIIDWMPYIIEFNFQNYQLINKVEHFHIKKNFDL